MIWVKLVGGLLLVVLGLVWIGQGLNLAGQRHVRAGCVGHHRPGGPGVGCLAALGHLSRSVCAAAGVTCCSALAGG
jgi:hypothetical protein